MARIKIKVLRKGDSVVSATDKAIAVRRKNGEVDLIPIIPDGGFLRVDLDNIVTVSYGSNSIETTVEGDSSDAVITTF